MVLKAWTLSSGDVIALMVFERKVERRIFESVCEHGVWKIRKNEKIEGILLGQNVVIAVRLQRIDWLGHVERMTVQRQQREIMHG